MDCGLRNDLQIGGKCWLKRHMDMGEGGSPYALSILEARWPCSQWVPGGG